MGDVAILIPVLRQFLEQQQGVQIDLLTQPIYFPFFEHIDRVRLLDFDTKGKHKKLRGIYSLYHSIKKNKYGAVLDLHDVLRSRVLTTLLKSNGKKVIRINKGRSEKKRLVKRQSKDLTLLKTSAERYRDVFLKAGFSFELNTLLSNYWNQEKVQHKTGIGIAPFAFHKEKMWPFENTKQVIENLLNDHNEVIYLFGGGLKETAILDQLANGSTRIENLAHLKLADQLKHMSGLKVLLSMDSSNMHMASATGCPVISIWQATHPFAGFAGFGQHPDTYVQRDDLACRPCSVFGNKTCHRGDWACQEIGVSKVKSHIISHLD